MTEKVSDSNVNYEKEVDESVLKGEIKDDSSILEGEIKNSERGNHDTHEMVGHERSQEALCLEEKLNGKIVLRPDGKIDFPEICIEGVQRLSISGETDFTTGLVQGDYVDKNNKKGISGVSYVTGARAMQEVKKRQENGEKCTLLIASEAEKKIEELLMTLGTNGQEQSAALQILFGKDFSEGYWSMFSDSRTSLSGATICMSDIEKNDHGSWVYGITYKDGLVAQTQTKQKFPQPFIICEGYTP